MQVQVSGSQLGDVKRILFTGDKENPKVCFDKFKINFHSYMIVLHFMILYRPTLIFYNAYRSTQVQVSGTQLGEAAVQNNRGSCVAKRIVLIHKKENTKVCIDVKLKK